MIFLRRVDYGPRFLVRSGRNELWARSSEDLTEFEHRKSVSREDRPEDIDLLGEEKLAVTWSVFVSQCSGW